jgi:hypothetical protein
MEDTYTLAVEYQLKHNNYKRILNKSRKQLSLFHKALSHVIHASAVHDWLELLSECLFRPTALFGAGLFSLLGSLVYFSLVQLYGDSYNFNVYLLLMLSGYLAGLISEGLSKLLRR